MDNAQLYVIVDILSEIKLCAEVLAFASTIYIFKNIMMLYYAWKGDMLH